MAMPVDLGSYNVKTFNIPISSRPVPASGSEGGAKTQTLKVLNTIPVNIVEPGSVQADNLPLSTWASSMVLARNLHRLDLDRHIAPLRDDDDDDKDKEYNGDEDEEDEEDDEDDSDEEDGSDGDSSSSSTPRALSPTTGDASTESAAGPSSSSARRASSGGTQKQPKCTAGGPIHPILELGAGTGLVGLTASMLYSAPYTTLSDVAGIVVGVAANIAVNAEALVAAGSVVRAGVLEWGEACGSGVTGGAGGAEGVEGVEGAEGRGKEGSSEAAERPGATTPRPPAPLEYPLAAPGSTLPVRLEPGRTRARLILAADTVYDEVHAPQLAGVVSLWLERGPAARFVVCYPLRVAYLDYIRDLWARLERAGLRAEHEGREQAAHATNGDDELLCEFVVWAWTPAKLAEFGRGGGGSSGVGVGVGAGGGGVPSSQVQQAVAQAAAASGRGKEAEEGQEQTKAVGDAPAIRVDDLTEKMGQAQVRD